MIFNEDDDMPQEDMVPMSEAFTGGNAEGRTYKILDASMPGMWLTYGLEKGDDGTMLKLSVAVDLSSQPEDAVIRVRATDADPDMPSAVAYISVRANDTPVLTDTQTISLTVGTQVVDAPDGDYYASDNEADDEIICDMLNSCTIEIPATDTNLRDNDNLMWRGYSPSGSVSVTPADGGVRITGEEATTAAVDVIVWAVDKGGLPENGMDNADTPDVDESMFPATGTRTIEVTVDGAPTLSPGAVESVSLDVGDEDEVVGTVYDPEGDILTLDITETPERVANTNVIAIVNLENLANNGSTSATGQEIHVDGENTGSATFAVKVMEPATPADNPQQYAELLPLTVTVSQQGNN